MKYSRYESFSVSLGHCWPWGATGSIIEVAKNQVLSIESHPDGCVVITAQRKDSRVPMRVALYEPGMGTVIANSDYECDICHESFNGPQGLAQHRVVHKAKA
jgi:stress-induced morphogen